MVAASQYDVIVIGAGAGGVYAVHRFSRQGLSVLALESAGGVGGVWHHNCYPGARVDVPSLDYCYFFSRELYREWKWPELYSSQPELERYINHAADKFDLRKHILLDNRVTEARWLADRRLWQVDTGAGNRFTCRFLVTAMGNLTAPRNPDFPGLDEFRGEWVQTSRWPQRHVDLKGRRIGVIGNGASGVQVIPPLAREAEHLTVFQRTPNYVVPPQNRAVDPAEIEAIADRFDQYRAEVFASDGGTHLPPGHGPADRYSQAERERIFEEQWQFGGHPMSWLFDNAQTDWEVSRIISELHHDKVRSIVRDPAVAEKLCPYEHGVGNRRLGVCQDFYETFNRDNVSLVDLRESPFERFTPTGIRTRSGHHELDLVVFAIGFRSFTGTLIDAGIRNEHGAGITDHWKPGWKTVLGVMTTGFPNLFMACGTGGIGFSANVFPFNEQQMDWIGDCIAWMDRKGHGTIEADPTAQEAWVRHVAQTAGNRLLMTRGVTDRSVHVDPETGTRVCNTYLGGLVDFIARCDRSAANGYEGFVLR
ncbi:MAG: flavin-containing monooxygenase [Gammaproteobacteria bacterium]